MKTRAAAVSIVMLAMLMALAVPVSNAAPPSTVPNPDAAFCSGVISSTNSVLNHPQSLSYLVEISVILLLTVATVLGIVYSFGYSFKINRLTNFAKNEFGEIIVTVLIIAVFIGTFSVFNSTYGSSSIAGIDGLSTPTSPSANAQIFSSDCSYLAYYGVTVMPQQIIAYSLLGNLVDAIKNVKVTLQPNGFGPAFSPFSGFAIYRSVLDEVVELAGGIAGLFLATIALLAIFFSLFPIFLYVGIVLRSFPWTRAAGGAMLALFFAFYLIFPILLHFLLSINVSIVPPTLSPYTLSSLSSSISSFSVSAPTGIFSSLGNLLSLDALFAFISGVLVPMGYSLIAIGFTFIISFDMMETLADMLGAPSLSRGKVLNKLI